MSEDNTRTLERVDVLQLGPWLSELLAPALGPRLRLLPAWTSDRLASSLAAHATTVRAIVTHTNGMPADRALMDSLPALQIVVNLGSGSETIDLAAAAERGVRVLNGAGTNAPDVAELAMLLMLAVGRTLIEGDRHVRAGRWPLARAPTTRRVSGKRLGLLGMGEIARAIARRATGFDMEISYFSRSIAEGVVYRHVADPVALALQSDFLVVALPGGAATRHLVNVEVLRALGPEGVLVNIGRGTVVDEAALIRALREGWIAGAGLDVFENEPHVPEALRALDNVVLQAHRGGSTHEAFQAVVDRAAASLHSHFFRTSPTADGPASAPSLFS